jgi:hypothetical protein
VGSGRKKAITLGTALFACDEVQPQIQNRFALTKPAQGAPLQPNKPAGFLAGKSHKVRRLLKNLRSRPQGEELRCPGSLAMCRPQEEGLLY